MVASANIGQSPISGKYGRVLVSVDGSTLYPVNLNKWSIEPETDNIDTTGFEAAGFGEGITGIVQATINLEGPYQVNRTGGLAAPGMQILISGRWIYYNLYQVHPDYNSNALGSLLRYSGIAQVIGHPVDQDVRQRGNVTIRCATRGPIYLPGVAEALSPQAQIALYSTGILS